MKLTTTSFRKIFVYRLPFQHGDRSRGELRSDLFYLVLSTVVWLGIVLSGWGHGWEKNVLGTETARQELASDPQEQEALSSGKSAEPRLPTRPQTVHSPARYRSLLIEESFSDIERRRVMILRSFFVVYLFALGATVGSFLNVVVYRLPRGLGLLRPGSRCPVCETPIRILDNIPILGWLKLCGKCRACKTKISPRYPFVEAITGSLFLILGWVELLEGGKNLPLPLTQSLDSALWVASILRGDLIGLYLYHLVLVFFLLASGLILWDREHLPGKLALGTFLIGLLAPLYFSHLHPVSFAGISSEVLFAVQASLRRSSFYSLDPEIIAKLRHFQDLGWQHSLLSSALGIPAGILGGAILWLGDRSDRNNRLASSTALLLTAICGTYLGWQAILSVAVLSVLGRTIWRIVGSIGWGGAIVPTSFFILSAVVTQILFWDRLSLQPNWPGPASPWFVLVAWLCGAALLSFLSRWIPHHLIAVAPWSEKSGKDYHLNWDQSEELREPSAPNSFFSPSDNSPAPEVPSAPPLPFSDIEENPNS